MVPVSEDVPDRPSREPRWRRFDARWYLLRYPEAREQMRSGGYEDPYVFYQEVGQTYGHSPNRYFDEVWYRDVYADVRQALIQEKWRSGFEHYCAQGYVSHSAHWLFDEEEYRRRYPELTQRVLAETGLWNGYDHYLEIGEASYSTGSRFFDEALCQELSFRFPEYFDSGSGLFASWLALPSSVADSGRVSWYFDPVWYLTRYPEVAAEIAAGRFASALHHYLTNETPRRFDPQPFFSEQYYASAHPDVAPALADGAFRNGYEHFVRFGAHEGRAPAQGIDLRAHSLRSLVRQQVEGDLYDSPFAHLVAARSGAEDAGFAEEDRISEIHTRLLFEREAEAQLPAIVRQPLDFSVHGIPEISVIMVVYGHIALTMQALASLRANYVGAIELIVVDSGSRDETRHLPRLLRGARILRYRYNIGYLDGCNAALEKVTAPFVLYLNNDVRLYPGAVAHALGRFRADVEIGAVGAKLIRTNMKLQEAGSIIWRDGATYGYRREDDPNLTEANFVRDVDYCSAAFLVVRSALLRRLNGYDTRYRPAYFEDTDLCVRLIKAGARIVYDPNVVVEHLEFGSSGHAGSHALIQGNLRKFARAQQDFLRLQQPAHIRNAVLGRERRSERRHILFIEDRLPLRRLGSGYVRSNDVIREMAKLGYQVTVYPMLPRRQSVIDLFGDFPENVELISDQDISNFAEFIQERAGYYDLVWVGRTHNMSRLLPILNELSRYLPNGGAVLDTEVVATPRIMERIRVLELPEAELDFDEMLRQELECAHYCQQIVAVTQSDAALIRRAGYANVSVLGHEMRARPTRPVFDERRGILFLGALHDDSAPNYDSLEWFIGSVLPCLEEQLPPDVRFTIAGYIHPSVDMAPFAQHPRIDIAGPVEDLAALFATHRVFVAPTRFAGGLPFKVQEAAGYGLPVVATELIRSQVGWAEGEEILSAGADDPQGFAAHVVDLHENAGLWEQIRRGGLDAVKRDCAPERFRHDLLGILQSCIA